MRWIGNSNFNSCLDRLFGPLRSSHFYFSSFSVRIHFLVFRNDFNTEVLSSEQISLVATQLVRHSLYVKLHFLIAVWLRVAESLRKTQNRHRRELANFQTQGKWKKKVTSCSLTCFQFPRSPEFFLLSQVNAADCSPRCPCLCSLCQALGFLSVS